METSKGIKLQQISEKILKSYDNVEITSSNKPKVFHYKREIRRKLTAQQRRKVGKKYNKSKN